MGDRRALQAGTSHFLGQNFAKAFDIQYLDEHNQRQHCWTTSWGMSTRMVGAIVMVHGDDQGLVLPPRLAPIQVVIVPIWRADEEAEQVLEAVARVEEMLSGVVKVHVDRREGYSPGWKYNEWELRGVPLRIEIGPRDVRQDQVMLARRDIPGRAGKSPAPVNGLVPAVQDLLATIQSDMFQRALDFREAHTHDPKDYAEFAEAVVEGFADSWWCEDEACEAQIKDDTKATVRCIPMEQEPGKSTCIHCGQEARVRAIFARAY